ncbi:MAG: hypothetical protein ACRD3S_09495 [Terracidiphilus sp.]
MSARLALWRVRAPGRRQVMKADQEDLFAFTVLGHFEEIEHPEKA